MQSNYLIGNQLSTFCSTLNCVFNRELKLSLDLRKLLVKKMF